MKIVFPLFLMVLIGSCNGQNSLEITSLKYYAQTRGFLVEIHVNNKEIVYNNNSKIETRKIEKETWNSLNNLANHLDFDKLKNYTLPEELLATDRAIKAELTITTDNDEQLIEFIHGNPPEGLKNIIEELFRAVAN